MRECTGVLFLDGNSCRVQRFAFPISKKMVWDWYDSLRLPPGYEVNPANFKDEFPFALEGTSINGKHRILIKFSVNCPCCGCGALEVKHDGVRPFGYVCPVCNATFDASQYPASNPKCTIFVGKHRSKLHLALLNSDDTIVNFLKSCKLECAEIPLHDELILMYVTME